MLPAPPRMETGLPWVTRAHGGREEPVAKETAENTHQIQRAVTKKKKKKKADGFALRKATRSFSFYFQDFRRFSQFPSLPVSPPTPSLAAHIWAV